MSVEVFLAASGTEGVVHACDVDTFTPLAAYKDSACARGGLCRLGHSHFLAAQASKGAVHGWVWGREAPVLRCHAAEALASLAGSPDGALLAAGSVAGALLLWQAATGRLLRTWTAHASAVTCLSWAPDGSWLASAGDDGGLAVWSLARLAAALPGGASAAATAPGDARTAAAHTLAVTGVAWSEAGTRAAPLLASASLDRRARLWALSAGGTLMPLRTLAFPAPLTALGLCPVGSHVYVGSAAGRVYAAPLAGTRGDADGTASGGFELSGHTRAVRALAATACGRRLLSCGDDGAVTLWCLASRQPLHTATPGKGAPLTALLLAPPAVASALRLGGAIAAHAAERQPLPLAPLAKFASDAPPPGARPWDGPLVWLRPGSPSVEPVAEDPQVGPSSEAAELRVQLEEARAEAQRWRALHGELRAALLEGGGT